MPCGNERVLVERTRLAPSPTGALHLGNARTFLVTWAMARRRGWRIVLRIDDLDGPRVKPAAAEQAVEDLRWLGIDWDEGPTRQTSEMEVYRAALERLAAAGAIYPCRCSRAEILAASLSAPHAGEHEPRYPGTCRPPRAMLGPSVFSTTSDSGWRVFSPVGARRFVDRFRGEMAVDLQATVGDFLVCAKSGTPSYQMAVVVDDARQSITQVVRGDDLLESTARQQWIADLLGLAKPRGYWHLPLVVGQDGRRLAKRHGDSRVARYRELGVPPGRVIGLLADWSGMSGSHREEMSAQGFLSEFDEGRVPSTPIVMRPEDDAWLLAAK